MSIFITVIHVPVTDRAGKGEIAVKEQCSLKIADANVFDQRSYKKIKADRAVAKK
ncbi:hypothetical protein KUC_0090 [Vreelandella boliviensis LC1]|uniref:Uncharacterized protein n=1 Tax=Vreelandella boliviensis LC1 TaxID=1072583 RepID=A0A7U9C221_9GAMM|nr:hypothetical protein KUC_0090 [Halomonas boliviensis LC1]